MQFLHKVHTTGLEWWLAGQRACCRSKRHWVQISHIHVRGRHTGACLELQCWAAENSRSRGFLDQPVQPTDVLQIQWQTLAPKIRWKVREEDIWHNVCSLQRQKQVCTSPTPPGICITHTQWIFCYVIWNDFMLEMANRQILALE